MKIFTQKEAEIFIIDYLLAHLYIGHRQTTFENMVRHVPTDDQKIAKRGLEELIRKGFISTKRKHYGIHISLIHAKLDEVRNYLQELEKK